MEDFHRRAAATGSALSPTVDRRVRRTSRDVDEAERIVVWLQCLLVDILTLLSEKSPVFKRTGNFSVSSN